MTASTTHALFALTNMLSILDKDQGAISSQSYETEDITTVYDALAKCDVQKLAEAIFLADETKVLKANFLAGDIAHIVNSRIESIRKVALSLEPNLECAADDVIIPWNRSHLASLACLSWPNALGRRVILPRSLSVHARHFIMAQILLSMSYV